jgi:hypothetical protein
MNKIHKLVACLVKPQLFFKVLVAMAISAPVLYLMNPSDEELRNMLLFFRPSLLLLPVTWGFMAIFYGDHYGVYWPSGTGWNLGYLSYDPYFYQTITSETSLLLKCAGYIYAITKLINSCVMGFALTNALFQINN